MYHVPVLLLQSINNLITNTSGIYIDATFGGGGHSNFILKKINSNGKLISFDQDEDSIINNKINDKRFELININFKKLKEILNIKNIDSVSGILIDLGISSHQINTPERGFSIRYNSELDMRMDKKSNISAKYVVNNYSINSLKKIFFEYGDLKNYNFIANRIVNKRLKKPINTTFELKNLFCKVNNKKNIKFLARLFQSIRIEVNNEINNLKSFLFMAEKLLEKKGRIVVISYHSIEDKLVKIFFKNGNFENNIKKDIFGNNKNNPKLHQIHSKAIKPKIDEINKNPRARSARLRIAEKK